LKTYAALFLSAAVLSLLLTPALLWLSRRHQWFDVPDGQRKIHTRPIPRIGGVAIFGAFALTLPLSFFWRNLVFDTLRLQWQDVVALTLPGMMMFLIGLYDDLRGLSARKKLALQIMAAGLLYYNGFRIEQIANPLGGPPLVLGWAGLPVTLFWVVGVTNAFNLIDGMDGLAAGIAFFTSVSLFFVSLAHFNPMVSVLSVVMAGATLGFLRYNFNPARIFMGDCGSYFLGFLAGSLAIRGAQKSSVVVSIAVPILLLGLPILDTAVAIVRRLLDGQPIFNPDQQHIHHRVLRAARSQRFTVIILYGATAFLGLMSWLMVISQSRLAAVISLAVGLIGFLGIRSLGYEEFQALGEYLTGLFARRQTLTHQIYLRKVAGRLESSRHLVDHMAVLHEMLRRLDFDGAEVRLSSAPAARPADAGRPAGPYVWEWRPGDRARPPEPPQNWELTLPLSGVRGTVGYLRLTRAVDKEPLPLAWHPIVQALVRKMGDSAAATAEDVLAQLFRPEAAPGEPARHVEVGGRR